MYPVVYKSKFVPVLNQVSRHKELSIAWLRTTLWRCGVVEIWLQASLILAVEGREWSASHPSRFIPRVKAPVPVG
jgi:hypothetical protein